MIRLRSKVAACMKPWMKTLRRTVPDVKGGLGGKLPPFQLAQDGLDALKNLPVVGRAGDGHRLNMRLKALEEKKKSAMEGISSSFTSLAMVAVSE